MYHLFIKQITLLHHGSQNSMSPQNVSKPKAHKGAHVAATNWRIVSSSRYKSDSSVPARARPARDPVRRPAQQDSRRNHSAIDNKVCWSSVRHFEKTTFEYISLDPKPCTLAGWKVEWWLTLLESFRWGSHHLVGLFRKFSRLPWWADDRFSQLLGAQSIITNIRNKMSLKKHRRLF